MTRSRYPYFWFLAGFATAVISFDGGTDPINAFDTAVLRAQETALGVLVYTLVTTLLWPTSGRAAFEAATAELDRRFEEIEQLLAGDAPGIGRKRSIYPTIMPRHKRCRTFTRRRLRLPARACYALTN